MVGGPEREVEFAYAKTAAATRPANPTTEAPATLTETAPLGVEVELARGVVLEAAPDEAGGVLLPGAGAGVELPPGVEAGGVLPPAELPGVEAPDEELAGLQVAGPPLTMLIWPVSAVRPLLSRRRMKTLVFGLCSTSQVKGLPVIPEYVFKGCWPLEGG